MLGVALSFGELGLAYHFHLIIVVEELYLNVDIFS